MDNKLTRFMQSLAEVYDRSGSYTACVKVMDLFGMDTSITVEVEVLS